MVTDDELFADAIEVHSEVIAEDEPEERHQRRLAAIRRGLDRPIPGHVCPECDGAHWVDVADPDKPGYTFVRPCSICSKERYEWWSDGHASPDHNRAACDHGLCNPRRRSG